MTEIPGVGVGLDFIGAAFRTAAIVLFIAAGACVGMATHPSLRKGKRSDG